MSKAPKHPTFSQALAFWLKLGFISFGGPAGQVSIMHEYLVEKKKWISESRFVHAFNYCMERSQSNAVFQSVLGYVTAAVTGVILSLGLYFGKMIVMPSLMEILWVHLIWVVISFISMYYLKVGMLAWIGISLCIGIVNYLLQ